MLDWLLAGSSAFLFIPSLTLLCLFFTSILLIFCYLSETSFYTAAPLSLCCTFAPEVFKFATEWVEEFIVKGKNQMAVGEFDAFGLTNPLMRQRWYAWIGAAIFLWGWVHQRSCHEILVSIMSSHSSCLIFLVIFLMCSFLSSVVICIYKKIIDLFLMHKLHITLYIILQFFDFQYDGVALMKINSLIRSTKRISFTFCKH